MILTTTGESRVNGYLFVLERSLKAFLPPDVTRDAVREIESHLRERIAGADGTPDERAALEKILAELGPPLKVAQAYSAERTIDEAVTTGRFVATARALWHLAVSTVTGFFVGLGLLTGYMIGVALLLIAGLKPIFPANVGLHMSRSGYPVALGALFPAPEEPVRGGYWIIPICLGLGLVALVVTQRCARKFLAWWRQRRLS
jgi:uncharacterized membrane protein